MAASKHTHARAQCSHASVGLTQARPNHLTSITDVMPHSSQDWVLGSQSLGPGSSVYSLTLTKHKPVPNNRYGALSTLGPPQQTV